MGLGTAFVDGDLRTIAERACNGAISMTMRGETKTTASEAYDDRKYADGDFIVIEADMKVDRCYFLYLLEYALSKSLVLS